MAQSLEKAASKNTANTALGLAIGALGVEFLRGGFGGCGLFGRGLFGGPCGGDGYGDGYGRGYGYDGYGKGYEGHCGGCCGCPSPFQVYAKECCDVERLICQDYNGVIMGLNNRFCDRQYTDCGFFNLEKQILCDKLVAQEKDCRLQNEITALKGHVATLEAVRPYQDKIIQLEICDARKDAHNELKERTCKMIQGELVLPSTPTVTGFPSFSCCNATTTTAAA